MGLLGLSAALLQAEKSLPLSMCKTLTYLLEIYKNVPRKRFKLPFPVPRSRNTAAPTSGMESWLFFVGFYVIYFIDFFFFSFYLKGNSFFGIENSSHSVNYNPWQGEAASYFSRLEPEQRGVCVVRDPEEGCVTRERLGASLLCNKQEHTESQAAARERPTLAVRTLCSWEV